MILTNLGPLSFPLSTWPRIYKCDHRPCKSEYLMSQIYFEKKNATGKTITTPESVLVLKSLSNMPRWRDVRLVKLDVQMTLIIGWVDCWYHVQDHGTMLGAPSEWLWNEATRAESTTDIGISATTGIVPTFVKQLSQRSRWRHSWHLPPSW